MKRTLCLAAAIIVILAFTISAGGQGEKAVPKEEAVNLEYWFSGSQVAQEFMRQAVKDFNAQYAHINLKLTITPQRKEQVAAAIAASTAADIMWFKHDLPWYYGEDAFYPLDEFILDPEIGIDPNMFFAPLRKAVHYGGHVMAVPFTCLPGVIRYHRNLVADAGLDEWKNPRTLEELTQWALKLTKREGDRVTQWGFSAVVVDWLLQQLLFAEGGDWVNDDLTEYLAEPELLTYGLQWWYDMIHKYKVMPITGGVGWTGSAEMTMAEQGFPIGLVAMELGGLTNFDGMRELNPSIDLGAFPDPLGPNGMNADAIKMSTGFYGLFILQGTKHPREAYEFIRWFTMNKAVAYTKVAEELPTTTAAMTDPDLINSPLFGRVIQMLQVRQQRNFHMFPGRLDVRNKEPEMAEKVLLGYATPKEAIDEFKTHADNVFEQWRNELQLYSESYKLIW